MTTTTRPDRDEGPGRARGRDPQRRLAVARGRRARRGPLPPLSPAGCATSMALDEIAGIGEALSLALASSERLLPELNQILPASRPSLARPSLVVHGHRAGQRPDAPRGDRTPRRRPPGDRRDADGLRGPGPTLPRLLRRRPRRGHDAGAGDDAPAAGVRVGDVPRGDGAASAARRPLARAAGGAGAAGRSSRWSRSA